LFAELFDDAALFPPGNAPMIEAVPAHRGHRTACYASLVGPFICPDTRLSELEDLPDLPRGMTISLVVTGGPSAISAVVPLAESRHPLAAVEVAGVRDAADAKKAVAALRATLSPATLGFVEVPRGDTRTEVLDTLAGTGIHAKFRTGGTIVTAFPDETELAEAIVAAIGRDLPFKCTAGLHHAVRHTAAGTGFEHHGFLNVLAATAAATGGTGSDEVARLLAERSADVVTGIVRALDDEQASAARQRFLSFGTCSITEPLDDLATLGLLPQASDSSSA
jgi:hypothetical protein